MSEFHNHATEQLPGVHSSHDGQLTVQHTAEQRSDASASDATRYLCAAAHIDPEFRDRVLEEVLHQPHRAVAPSYGSDIGPVIRHCIAAERRVLQRDAVVTVVFLVALLVTTLRTIALTTLLLTAYLGWRSVKALGRGDFKAAALNGFGAFGLLTFLVPLTFAVALGDLGSMATGVVFAGPGALVPAVVGLLAFAFVAVLLWGVFVTFRLMTHAFLIRELTPHGFAPDRAPTEPSAWTERISYLEAAQRGRLTVYSPFSSRPFVGSGFITGNWSLASPLKAAAGAASTAAPKDLTSDLLYDRVRSALAALNSPSLPPHERVRGLALKDRVFASGLLPPNHPFIDQRGRRPRYQLTSDEVAFIAKADRGAERHYLAARTASWRGEVETTTFIYLSVVGRMVYVEVIDTVLPPISPDYHLVDAMHRLTPSVVLRTCTSALGDMLAAPAAPFRLLKAALNGLSRSSSGSGDATAIRNRMAFDYGARASVREIGSGDAGVFHKTDALRHSTIVQRRLIEAVAATLVELGYDASDFLKHATTVIDNSVNVAGHVTGNAVVTGGSRSNVNVPAPAPASA